MAGNLKRFAGDFLEMELKHEPTPVVLRAEKLSRIGNLVHIRFTWSEASLTFSDMLTLAGKTPLPPYIKREPDEHDRERYQTVYSGPGGSVAAPTAGLHFTSALLDEIKHKGISLHEVTLHVGAGTFQPIRSEKVEEHAMHAEFIRIPISLLRKLRDFHGMVTAVGTTSVRTLESVYWLGVKCLASKTHDGGRGLSQWDAYHLPQEVPVADALSSLIESLEKRGSEELLTFTRLMIVPGYRFRMIDTLITNFHQPGSTLLLLVAAFMGPTWKETYRYALENNYRFLSYGDSSLLFL
jgi:S-adenosylmethionine:tRNA ribosyltransferase-isomerase